MPIDEFFAALVVFLRTLKPEIETVPEPTTHLWAEGYIDSLGMLELVFFLEEMLGSQIPLEGDFLPTFFTMDAIYATYIAQVERQAS